MIDWGSVSDAFAAVGTIGAVAVALWQSTVIRRQAKNDAVEAADRFQKELEAANARTIQEVEAAELRFQREQEAAAERHMAELEAQREVARIQQDIARVDRRRQEGQSLTELSRTLLTYVHDLENFAKEAVRSTPLSEDSSVVFVTSGNRLDEAITAVDRSGLAFYLQVQHAQMTFRDPEMQTVLAQFHPDMSDVHVGRHEIVDAASRRAKPDVTKLYNAIRTLVNTEVHVREIYARIADEPLM